MAGNRRSPIICFCTSTHRHMAASTLRTGGAKKEPKRSPFAPNHLWSGSVDKFLQSWKISQTPSRGEQWKLKKQRWGFQTWISDPERKLQKACPVYYQAYSKAANSLDIKKSLPKICIPYHKNRYITYIIYTYSVSRYKRTIEIPVSPDLSNPSTSPQVTGGGAAAKAAAVSCPPAVRSLVLGRRGVSEAQRLP